MNRRRPKSKFRLGCLTCVHDDGAFIPVVLKALPKEAEKTIFVSDLPWHGEAGDFTQVVDESKELGARCFLGSWPEEKLHREEAMRLLIQEGFSHALVLDTDEVLDPELARILVALAKEDIADIVRCRMETYWQDPMHVVRPREALAPTVLIKLSDVTHRHIREFDGRREILLPEECGLLHHLSYAGGDDRIHRKVSSWSHRTEVVPEWMERVWEGWKRDPLLRDVHPTHPGAYHEIRRVPVPELLRDAFGAASLPTLPKQEAWPKVSIIIPLHGNPEDIRACLTSLEASKDLIAEIIVVDDASPDEAPEVAQEFENVTLLSNSENLGFSATCNRGWKAASGEVIIFLNSDTLVPRSGLLRLVECLMQSGTVGAAGPSSDNVGHFQAIEPTLESLACLEDFAHDLAVSGRDDQDVDMLVGFCLAMRRATLLEVGGFDERFGKGLFEDNDLSYRLRREGYRLLIARKSFIHHIGSRTLAKDIEKARSLFQENEKKFRTKWSLDIQSGFASHLSGLSPEPVHFNQARNPDKILAEVARLRKQADISLCMIVKNEERVLADCLSSAQPFFNQIVVVDTGSTDATKEIAKEFGVELKEMEWPKSFSEARNESLRSATGRWIMWMDADDTLPFECGEVILQAALHAPPEVAGFIIPVQFVEGSLAAGTRVDHVKLFRNVPGVAFEGRIHEQIIQSLRPHGEIVRLPGAIVLHSGYDSTPTGQAKKRDRDWSLLELDLEERPNHPFVLFNFGMTHHFTDSHEEAVSWLTKCLASSKPEESHVRKAYALLGASYRHLDQLNESEDALREGLACVGNDPELLFQLGVTLTSKGELKAALQAYDEMPSSADDHYSSIDQGILTYKKDFNRAMLFGALEEYREALVILKILVQGHSWFAPAHPALFEIAIKAGNLMLAKQSLQWEFDALGESADWASRMVDLESQLRGPFEAEKILMALAGKNQNEGTMLVLARLLCRSQRVAEALPYLEWLEERGSAEAAFYLGVWQIHQGNYPEALRWTERALELDPNSEASQQQLDALKRMAGGSG